LSLAVAVWCGTSLAGTHTLEREESKTIPVDGQHRISVENSRGKTVITGRAGATEVSVLAVKFVRAADKGAAAKWMDGLGFDVKIEDNEISIVSRYPDRLGHFGDLWDFLKGSRYNAQIDYTIEVPIDFGAKASSASGDVHVTSLRGDVKVVGSSGDVFLKDLGRRASVEVASGEIEVESVEGDVWIRQSSGDATVTNVGGSLSMQATSGDVEAYYIAGDADVEIASGDLLVRGCEGDLHVKAASGDCVLSEIGGNVNASAASGDVHLTLAPARGRHYEVHTASGNVHVTFSSIEETGFVLDVVTNNGTIEGDLDIRLDKVSRRMLRGKVGRGEGRLYIETASGNIRIQQSERQN